MTQRCVNPECNRDVSRRTNGYAACKTCYRKSGIKRATFEPLYEFNDRLAIYFGINPAETGLSARKPKKRSHRS